MKENSRIRVALLRERTWAKFEVEEEMDKNEVDHAIPYPYMVSSEADEGRYCRLLIVWNSKWRLFPSTLQNRNVYSFELKNYGGSIC